MKIFGIVGNPIEHSLSPLIHEQFFRATKTEGVYLRFPVSEENLNNAISGIKSLGISGVNITLPYKERVKEFLDWVDETSSIIGAVNTIHNKDGNLLGYNTDVKGFLTALKVNNVKLLGKRAVVIGAGGGARAVLYGLLIKGIGIVSIFNRTEERVKKILEEFQFVSRRSLLEGFHISSRKLIERIKQSDIIINATSVGLTPKSHLTPVSDFSGFSKDKIVFDLVCNENAFQREAKKRRAKVISGIPMLAYQARESFNIWTEKKISLDVIEKCIRDLRLS